jgi:hypothetical protein
MPPKRKIPQPIDRPLSRAYLRGFTGWSTAYPPGLSDPASVRLMENMQVDRNGALMVRPGLRYLSYETAPDLDPSKTGVAGTALKNQIVGSMEMFYVANGGRALLFAVREANGTVGFRALLLNGVQRAVYEITEHQIGFKVPQGTAALAFSSGTTYVKYLQINNKILALSDNGEPARLFHVGAKKLAKALNDISVPEWVNQDKLTVIHPDAAWINGRARESTWNEVMNPSFEGGLDLWSKSASTGWQTRFVSNIAAWRSEPPGQMGAVTPTAARELELTSLPTRTNLLPTPLMVVNGLVSAGWHKHPLWTPTALLTASGLLHVKSDHPGRFYASSARITEGVEAGRRYRVAVDMTHDHAVQPELLVQFSTVDGAPAEEELRILMPKAAGRFVSGSLRAPDDAVTMRVSFGGSTANNSGGSAYFEKPVVCRDGESTDPFTGSSGTNYFWTGVENKSASVFHPPRDVAIWSDEGVAVAGKRMFLSVQVTTASALPLKATLQARLRTKDQTLTLDSTTASLSPSIARQRLTHVVAAVPAGNVRASLGLVVESVARGDRVLVDHAMLVNNATGTPDYFDGSTLDTPTASFTWSDPIRPHASRSARTALAGPLPALVAETPTAKTLVKAGGATENSFKMAFFYTFENEVGESAASMMTEIRIQRPWANWIWETANAAGEPSGTANADPDLACDQLVAQLPRAVFDQAMADGALRWNLYAMSWSDQNPVPVEAVLLGSRELRSSIDVFADAAISYDTGGWIAATPARRVTMDTAILPTALNRFNYSRAPRHRNGAVIAERMILVGNPDELASIQWTSNRPAESTNFTPSKGGGSKTLTSGNLNVPTDVALWQNPQSADSITILCTGDDGESVAYYMAPAEVGQGQSGVMQVMGFEQVTSTPGTSSPYSAQVINNSLIRPLDHGLLKSTANNYNLNHMMLSDDIENMWKSLSSKNRIVAMQLEGRLYVLVHNPFGETLRQGCRGNEIWVYDTASKSGSWSRYLIQASSLKTFTLGSRVRLGIIAPEGLHYLDQDYRIDDYVAAGRQVLTRPIPWLVETNTQGANRAHDAWAHVQQLVISLGDFRGRIRYGLRGHTIDGKPVKIEKEFSDTARILDGTLTWDVDDMLLVRRDMKEWFFFASSVPDEHGWGQINAVQYRYTPVSVNVGYEYGSIETYEYGVNVAAGPDVYAANGIPTPMVDFSRP